MGARTSRLMVMFTAFVAGLGLCLGVILFVGGRGSGTGAIQAAALGGPFHLIDQNGQPFSDKDLKGKTFLVFFGFTHCPDVCPTTLFEISEIMRNLGPEADRTAALFISVDPHVRGLTGDQAALAAVAKAYRVYYKKVPLDGDDYTMDHTAIVYLMDKEGRFVSPFNMKRSAEVAAADLRKRL